MKIISYIDLCCGIGGFRLGIDLFSKNNKEYKFKCVFSADIKKDAIITYNKNFKPSIKKTDIYDIKELPKFDMLCAGFPCQPFSTAGNKKGFKDNRGSIIFKIAEICKEYNPKIILLENVANLLVLEKGKIIRKIKKIFTDLGYIVSYSKLNILDFGIPQNRERVFIVCYNREIDFGQIHKKEHVHLKNIIDTTDTISNIDKNIIEKLIKLNSHKSIIGCKLNDKRGGKKNIHSWDLELNGKISKEEKKLMNMILLERRKKHWAISKKIKWMDGMPLTLNDIKTFYDNDNLEIYLNNLVEKKYLKLEQCKELRDGKRIYKKDSKEGYNICKGKLSFPINRILDLNSVAPTLTATDSSKLAVLIGDTIRQLNSNELKKLFGFPSSFIVPSDVNKFDLFGNAVCPKIIYEILKLIFKE